MYDFTNIDPVKCCAWLVLPTVYDESLSYGEQLNKFCKALNELIENNNNLPDYVAEMIQNYITSGAIDEVVRNILANYILNVKYPPKGITPAIGDGSADDTSAIQGCIDYAFNQGGGCVYFPYGKYLSRSLTLKSGVSLVGFDRYSTRIVQRGGDTKPLVSGGNVQNVQISKLTLDGNNEVQTDDLDVINVLGKDCLFTNLVIKSGFQCFVYNGLGGNLQVDNVVFGGAVKKVAVINGKDSVQFSNVKFNELGKVQGECVMEVGASDGVYSFSSSAISPLCISVSGSRNTFNCDIINASSNFKDTGDLNNFNVLGVEIKEQLAQGKSSIIGGSVTERISGSKTETIETEKVENIVGSKTEVISTNKTENITGNKTEVISKNKSENINGNREIDINGTDSIHIDGVSTFNIGGARTEVYGNSRNIGVSGANTEEYHNTMTENFNEKHITNGNDETNTFTGNVINKANKFSFTSNEKSFPINFPDKTVDLYSISDLTDSVIFINKRGAKGDGVTDDTTIFKNVLNEIKESKKTCLILLDPNSVYKISDTLEIDIFTTSLNGLGATIKYTDNGKPLFNVVNSFTLPTNATSINEFYNGNSTASYKGISHVQLINEYPDAKPTSTCFKFVTHELTTDTEAFKNLASCSMIQFYSVAVRGFYVGLEVFSRTYNIAWFGGLLSCFINVYIPDGGVDYYERLSFSNVTFTGIATSTESTCFLVQEELGVITVDSSSIDYVKTVASMINGSKLYISNTHIETNTNDKYWFELYGGTPTATTVYLNNCVLSVQSPLKTPIFLVNTDVASGGLIIDGLYIWCVVDNEYYTKYPACLVNGGGRVITKKISFNQYSTILPISSYMSIISDWQYYGSKPIFTLTNGTMDSTIKHSGTHSIKLNQNGSATLKINNLGNWLLGSIWCYSAVNSILTVKINELNADSSVASSSTFNINVNNQWKANIFSPTSIHNYADKIEITLTANSDIYVDDVLLNVV